MNNLVIFRLRGNFIVLLSKDTFCMNSELIFVALFDSSICASMIPVFLFYFSNPRQTRVNIYSHIWS